MSLHPYIFMFIFPSITFNKSQKFDIINPKNVSLIQEIEHVLVSFLINHCQTEYVDLFKLTNVLSADVNHTQLFYGNVTAQCSSLRQQTFAELRSCT